MNSVLGAVTAFRACPQVSLNSAARSQGSHPYDDSTLPLIDRSQRAGAGGHGAGTGRAQGGGTQGGRRTSLFTPPLLFSSGPAI